MDLLDNLKDFQESKAGVVWVITFYLGMIPYVFTQILPVALLLAVLYSLTRMSKANELISMLGTGQSLMRVLRPIFVCSVYTCLLNMAANYYWGPRAEGGRDAKVRGMSVHAADSIMAFAIMFHNEQTQRTWFVSTFPFSLRSGHERMHGVQISQTQRLRDAGVDLRKLARDGVTIFFTQVFRDGYFHADMHPGNIQVSLDPATFGRYISLDFGIVGTLTESDKEYLAQNFAAFFRRDYKRVAELHIESGWVPPGTRINELEGAIRTVCEPYFDRPLKEISLGMVLMRLFQTSRRFNVEIQPQLVLLQKTLLNIEGLGRQLDPELDLWSTAKPFLEKWMLDQLGPQRFRRELRAQAPHYAKIVPSLPRLLHDFLQHPPGQQHNRELLELLREQRHTNRLLQGLVYVCIGFVLGLIVMQVLVRVSLF